MARILVVDDDPYMRESLLDSLESQGHRGEAQSEAAGGLEALAARDYDLVITDLKMPGMNGLEFLARVRRLLDA